MKHLPNLQIELTGFTESTHSPTEEQCRYKPSSRSDNIPIIDIGLTSVPEFALSHLKKISAREKQHVYTQIIVMR